MKRFDRKFGGEFLDSIPSTPGVYRIFGAGGDLIYVGKSKNLRRRLGQYRNARRRKRDRKMSVLVKEADRIEFETCASDLDACLLELKWIQDHRPRWNLAGAFSFLYPFVAFGVEGRDATFLFTTNSEMAKGLACHGAFRSREICGEAFFGLMRLLKVVSHAEKMPRRDDGGSKKYLFRFRQFPENWGALWESFFRGQSSEALETLCLRLLEHKSARENSSEVQEDLKALRRFYRHEAVRLREAIQSTGHIEYPVGQRMRDALFLRHRGSSDFQTVESAL